MSNSHSLSGSSNRSLAHTVQQAALATPLPLSPFSENAQSGDLVQRSLYPAPGPFAASSVSPHAAAFAPEPTVYRSVTLDTPQSLGHSPFDPLAQFDRAGSAGGYGGYAKDLSLNPKQHFQIAQQADFKPAHKSPVLFEAKPAPPKPAASAPPAICTAAAAPGESALPPPAPMWLEPNSHFYCSCEPPSTPMELFETVHATLLDLQENIERNGVCTLDCVPQPERFKLCCTAYNNRSGASTPFTVRVFTADAAKFKFCVEFQRSRGDCVHFFELFRVVRTRVQAAHPLRGEQPPASSCCAKDSLNLASLDAALPQPSLRSWMARPLPSEATSSGAAVSKEQLCETVRSLLQMCASNCMDIKTEGILALAELACTPAFDDTMQQCKVNMHDVLVSEGCFKFFLDCLPIEQQDVHRASLTALANLAETQAHLCPKLMSDEKTVCALLQLASSSPTCQVVREALRLLKNCVEKLGADWLNRVPQAHKPHFAQVVQQLMQHRDAKCRKHASDISKCICDIQQSQSPAPSACAC